MRQDLSVHLISLVSVLHQAMRCTHHTHLATLWSKASKHAFRSSDCATWSGRDGVLVISGCRVQSAMGLTGP